VIPWPDPPLRSGDLVLRPWQTEDAPALVAAWEDPEIRLWTGVPERRDLAAAQRWIAGVDARRARWLSLDLVVDRGGAVVGEVGLWDLDRAAGTAQAGWWTAAAHRGKGVATTATTLLVRWATTALGLHEVLARCDPANPASRIVAERAGARVWS